MKMNLKSQKGQGLTEYAVVLSLVAVASIAAMALFGGAVKGKVAALSGAISGDKNYADDGQKHSTEAAKQAAAKAGKVSGMKIDEDKVFDKADL